MERVEITTEYIKLDQFLKWTGVAETGVHAKASICEGMVKVNGKVEMQRGKKLRKGDKIEVGSSEFIID